MADKMQKWRGFLVKFALSIGKKYAEIYVDFGAWKTRQGGNGVEGAEDASLVSAACATDENAFVYRLTHPFDDGLAGMFTPLGIVSKDLGNHLTHEVLVLDAHTKVPMLAEGALNVRAFVQRSQYISTRMAILLMLISVFDAVTA